MVGRGADQALEHPSRPELHERVRLSLFDAESGPTISGFRTDSGTAGAHYGHTVPARAPVPTRPPPKE
jgi:hypothetical protein